MNLNFLNKIKQKFKSGAKKAFSLNDLSILVSTAAIVVVSSVAISNIKVSNTKQKLDAEKIEAIYNNIGKFLLSNKRLPCPAGIKRIRGKDANYALESYNSSTGACDVDEIGGVYYVNNVNSNLIYGAVPALNLGLDSEFAEDQYGSKIIYVIDKRAANRYSAEIGSGNVNIGSIQDASIIIKEDAVNVSSDSIFAIITVGKNKLGGFNANSSTSNSLPTDSFEQQNSYTSISGQVIAMDNTFQKSIKDNTVFDDIVFFANRKSLIADFKADFLIPCTGADTTKYSSSTASFGQILYAKNNCVAPYANLTPATKCEKDGKWVSYTSCPCYLKIDTGEVKEEWVPNGQRTAKCLTEKGYDGVLKYTCNEDSSLSIPAIDSKDRCQKRCNTTGIVGLKNASIPDGVTSLNCDEENYQGTVVLTCENGIVKNPIIGSCKISTCNIGGYSGMLLGTYPSGTLGASGVCDTANGYTGSYKCDCIDGESKVYDECFKNCTFSTLGIAEVALNHGNHTINCGANYLGGPVSVNCNDGTAIVKSGKCYKNGECSVGNGAGMIPLSVPFNTSLKTNGQCLDGYQGSYSYSCSIEGVAQVTNNCNKILKCIFSESKQRSMLVDGMLPKELDVGTSGNGECIPGFGGFYKWNCSATAVGSITEDNCEKSCKIGGTSGIAETTVDYGKTGENICDIVNGYAGTYSWSCAEDADKKVVGAITNNSCFNTCFVGTPLQGSGMYQKSVILNTSGIDGTCASGYVGSYSWKCEKNGSSSVVNNCKNTCRVGVGTGMTEKNVAIPYCTGANCPALISDNTGTGLCDSNKGYTGSYNWTCNASGVGNSVNGCVLRSCTIYDSVNRNSKTSSAGLAGKDGTCKAGYFGSYTWGCSFQGVGSIISDDCQAINCVVSDDINGVSAGTIVAYGTNDYYCNATGYRTDLTARFKCDASGTSAVGAFSQINGWNFCEKVKCTIPSNSNTTIAGTSVDFTTKISSLTCKPGFSGDPKYTCTGTGAVGSYNPSGTSCAQNSCTVLAGTGYISRSGLGANSFSCDAGYSGTINYVCDGSTNAKITGTCDAISCTISGTGYTSKSLSGSGTSNCDAGFAGSFSYACTGLSTATVTNNTCTAIKCSSTAYNGLSTSVLTNLNFTPGISTGTVTCDQAGYAGTASYTCTGTSNPGTFNITSACNCADGFETISGSCGTIQCLTSIEGFQTNTPINYSSASSNYYYCNDAKYNNFITTTFPSCTTSKILTPSSSCVKISCSTASLNTTATSIFIGNGQNLSCATGYYSASGVTTDCVAVYAERADNNIVPNTGALANISGTCARIKCTIPAGSNFTIGDLTQVDFTGTTPVSVDCKSGYTSSLGANNPPSYTCKGTGATGTYVHNGTCDAISCTSSGNGYLNQNGLAYTPTAGTGAITCNQTGYTGTANYTCQASGAASITKTCDCDDTNGYSRNSSAEACVKVQCSIPSGYNLSVVAGSKVDFTTGLNTGSINCANGFYNASNLSNSITYTCKIGTGITGNYLQTGSCIGITCTAQSATGFSSKIVNYTTGATDSVTCDEGFTGTVTYSCKNHNSSITPTSNCTAIQCVTSAIGFESALTGNTVIPYSIISKSYYCTNPIYNNFLTATFSACSSAQTLSPVENSCTKISCSTSSLNVTQSSIFVGNNQILNCAEGYYSSIAVTRNCVAVNASRSDGAVVPNSGNLTGTSGTCTRIKCTIPVGSNLTIADEAQVDFSTSAVPLTCKSGFVSSLGATNPFYTCKGTGATGNYVQNGTCNPITCIVPLGVNGFKDGTIGIKFGINTYYCNAEGYNTTTSASFNCGVNGISSTGSFSVASNGCAKNSCIIPSGTGYNSAQVSGSGTYLCNSGYSGSVTYTCNNVAPLITTSNTCAIIDCTIPAGTGYISRSGSGVNSFPCDAGYSGTINYTCTGATTASTSGSCSPIKCSSTAYNGLSTSVLTNLNFTPGISTGTVTCDQAGYTGTASYTCTGTTNPGTFTLTSACNCAPGYESNIITGACGVTQCSTSIDGFQPNTPIPYSTTSKNYYCNDPIYNNLLTTAFPACTTSQTLSLTSSCVKISCSTASLNTTATSIFIGTGQNLSCATGYYSASGVTTDCVAVYANRTVNSVTTSVPSTGALSGTSGSCTRIKCTIPSTANTTIDGTSVDFSTSAVPLTCKSGFVSSLGATNPYYTCTGTGATGTYFQNGTCNPITCTVPAGVTGFTALTSGITFGTNTYNCNAAGFNTANVASFTCGVNASNPTSTTGTLTVVSNGCSAITCSAPAANGYSAKTGLAFTPTAGTGTIACDTTSGYTGNANYSCTGTANPGTFAITSTCACASGYAKNASGVCVLITCTIPAINSTNDNQNVNVTSSQVSLNCATGFSGSPSYECFADKAVVYSDTNYSGNSVAYSEGDYTYVLAIGNDNLRSFQIPSGYQISLYDNGFTNSSVILNYTSNMSSLMSTSIVNGTSALKFIKINSNVSTGALKINGTCASVTCSAPAANGYSAKTGLAFTATAGTGTIACDTASGYTGNANYSCTGTATPGTFTSTSTCACASGYAKNASGVCVNSCVIPASTGTTSVTTTGLNLTGNGNCASGYVGYFSYSCSATGDGAITLNNCYQGTFTEKLFTYTTSSQTVSGSPGTSYGLTWPDILTLNLPADYLFTSRIQMINGFYYNCGGYGSYHSAGISKTSGFGTTGGIIGSYCEPQPGSYSSFCNAGPQLMAPGIELRNGDVLRFSTSNYTGCGYSSAYFTLNLYYMAKPSCTVGGSSGMVSKVVIGGSSGTDGTCQAGYSGSYNWTCSNSGVSTVTNNCAIINCSIPAGTGYIAKSGSGAGSFSCDAGYSGTINYTCTSATTATVSGTCLELGCTIPSSFANLSSYNSVLATSTLSYIPCATGYYDAIKQNWNPAINRNSGETVDNHAARFYNIIGGGLSYSCSTGCWGGVLAMLNQYGLGNPVSKGQADGWCANPCAWHNSTTKSAGFCICDGGAYSAHFPTDAGSGLAYKCVQGNLYASSSCQPITCTSSGNGYLTQSSLAYTPTAGTGVIACNQTGYTGNANYTCQASGSAIITKTCDCATGYAKDGSGNCIAITCTAPASNGYLAQSGLAFTATAGTGVIACNQTGYTGNANYTCQASGVASITSTCNCATGYTKNANGACVASSNSFTPNWYDSASAPAGVYVTTSSINSIGMAGPNNAGAGSWGYYLANLPTWVTKVSFNWTYYANDYGDFDRGYFFINGGWQYLANNNCTGCSSSGTITNWAITNMSDRRFGPGVWTQDGCCGAGFLTLSNIVFQ